MTDNWQAELAQHKINTHPLDGSQPDLFLCPLSDLAITTLSGEQSLEYLQGQLTCDVNELTENNHLKAAHCDPKGKAWAVLDVFKKDQTLFLSAHIDELAASTAQLQKYGVFAKTTISTQDNYFSFGLAGPDAWQYLQDNLQLGGDNDATAWDIEQGKVLKMCDKSFLLVTTQPQKWLSLFADKLYHHSLWDYWCIQAGLPHLTKATSGEFVPQMINLQCFDAISFTKGCYTGQEMVARMKYLGKNKRAAFILHGSAAQLPEDGHEIQLAIGDNWRRSGLVLNVAGSEDNLHLLAVLPNDLEQDAQLRLKDIDGSTLKIKPLPYSL